MRLGIVGCGGISERHARGAASTPEVAIVACCDIRLEAAEAWGERHGCERSYGDYVTMVREHELDGVLLATWPSQHAEQILGCLDAGVRSILCEKSLAVSAPDALGIWSAATAAGALVVEAFMYRHHPALQTFEQLLAEGEIGTVDTIRAAFSLLDPAESRPDDPLRDWRQRREHGGGVPYDLACYCVDACNHLAGSYPRQVLAVSATSELYGTVDRLHGLVEYEDGTVGIVESSKRSDFDHELRASGARGHLVLPVAWRIEGPTEVLLRRSVGWGEFELTRFPTAAVDPYRLQLDSFAAAHRGVAPAMPRLEESVVDALTTEALLTSASERCGIEVKIPENLFAAASR
jgi:D-xylose 1-dehydrogenase (NADP+, D-xylono-1,5-lactone-forming)